VIVVDHASRRIPRRLGDLGLPAAELQRHIAWDIGSLAVARQVAAALDAPLVAQNYSRLVIDCNRDPSVATSIPTVGESIEIPGNIGLSEQEIAAPAREIFDPYHAHLRALLDAAAGGGATHHPGGPAQHDEHLQGRAARDARRGAVQPRPPLRRPGARYAAREARI
jgi:predicted N-formylglutamate amidohydrolase